MRYILPAMACTLALTAMAAGGAHASSRLSECQREAEEISGYHGQEARGFLAGTVRGGLGGAALGAAGGWVTDSGSKKTKKAAKRAAALGALIGGARAAAEKRKIDDKRET